MGHLNIVGKLNQAAGAADSFIKKRWDEKARRDAAREAQRLAEEDRQRWLARNTFLATITAKLTGATASSMPPLVCDPSTSNRAVFFITTPIAFGPLEVSKSSYNLLAKHVGMTMTSVSHWALVVVSRGFGEDWAYDLMSDQMALTMLGKNYFRAYEVDDKFIGSWGSCYYVGETRKGHEEIQELGMKHMTSNPRYHLLENNCQHLVEALVAELCNGAHVEQSKLSEELKHVSPKIAMDLMVARLRSRVDDRKEHEDSAEVKEDVDVLRGLLKLYDTRHARKKSHQQTIEAPEVPLMIMPAPLPSPGGSECGGGGGNGSQGLLMPPDAVGRSRSPSLPPRPGSQQSQYSQYRGRSSSRVSMMERERSPALPPRPNSSLGTPPATPPYFPPPPPGACQ